MDQMIITTIYTSGLNVMSDEHSSTVTDDSAMTLLRLRFAGAACSMSSLTTYHCHQKHKSCKQTCTLTQQWWMKNEKNEIPVLQLLTSVYNVTTSNTICWNFWCLFSHFSTFNTVLRSVKTQSDITNVQKENIIIKQDVRRRHNERNFTVTWSIHLSEVKRSNVKIGVS